MSNTADMGMVELWLGTAGCGKTGQALDVLRGELAHDPRGGRYLVPTVGHKRSIEHLLLAAGDGRGLLGDPVTTFFNFAEEVATAAHIEGRSLTELQKHLLLKRLIRDTATDAFGTVKRYPGFLLALREAVDELKVHMIRPEDVQRAARIAGDRGLDALAHKLDDLCALYGDYQGQMLLQRLYDSEGLMWIAAEALKAQPALCGDLRCLILDGFARLTPIQVHFVQALAAHVPRVIVLFDCDRGRASGTYHPVLDSITALRALKRQGVAVRVGSPCFCPKPAQAATTALKRLQQGLFAHRLPTTPPRQPDDASLQLFIGATPAQEAAMIAREIHALLREGRVDGEPLGVEDIAVLARNADGVMERLALQCARYGIPLRRTPPRLAHTAVGRALLGALALVRDGWRREGVVALLRSGMLDLPRDIADHAEMLARAVLLPEGKAAWLAGWPHADSHAALAHALAPLDAFDRAYHQGGTRLLEGARALLAAFRAVRLDDAIPFPEADPDGARRRLELLAAFRAAEGVLDELAGLESLLGGFRGEEVAEVLATALLQEAVEDVAPVGEGVAVLSAHTTGGEKYKVVFLCDLREGAFPQHRRESAFLLDDERERELPELKIPLDPRKHLEEDERYWFLHAVCSATRRLVLSYPAHGGDGSALERSSFLDEVERVAPELAAPGPWVRATAFRDLTPPLGEAEIADEYLAALVLALRTAETASPEAADAAAAYAAWPLAQGPASQVAQAFRRAAWCEGTLTPETVAQLAGRAKPFSASELQAYRDCPFLWFANYGLRLSEIEEAFSPLDRGQVTHEVLRDLYAGLGRPLDEHTVDELMPRVEAALAGQLAASPRFQVLPAYLQEIETATLRRIFGRFLAVEIERASERAMTPTYLEWGFNGTLRLGDLDVPVRGRIDRIDLADDGAVVIDYKANAADYSGKKLERGEYVQAPLYALAVRDLLGRPPLGAEYLGLKKGERKGIYSEEILPLYTGDSKLHTLQAAAWEDYLALQAHALGELVGGILAGRIACQPRTAYCPARCSAWPLCRGSESELKARLHANTRAQEEAPVG